MAMTLFSKETKGLMLLQTRDDHTNKSKSKSKGHPVVPPAEFSA